MVKRKVNRFLMSIGVLFCGTGFISCEQGIVYEQMEDIEVTGWNYSQPVTFNFTAPDTVNKYNLIFDVRLTPDYAYQNLWLFIETTEPDGFMHVDSLNCPLAFPDGRWVGSGMGDLIDTPILIHRSFKFTKEGEYKMRVRHGMRNDYLANIQNLGVMLKRLKD